MAAQPEVDPARPLLRLESPDGRSFVVRGPLSERPSVGSYLEVDDDPRVLAFVEDVTAGTPKGQFTAVGSLVALPGAQAPSSAGSQLWDVGARRTRPEKVARLLSGSDPRLRLGQLAGVPDVGVAIVPKRLNRHTFWCGQSGSGKTYALGVFLERVLLTTRLPMVVFDPNSDFARLDEVSPSADPETAQALAALDVAVLRPGDEASPLRVAFTGLSAQAKAAVLRLDPIVDRREYNALLHLMAEIADVEAPEIVRHLRSLDDTDAEALAKRLENLGVLDWTSTWAYGAGTAIDVIDRRPAATVLDLGGYDRHEEQLTVALAVLEALWARRAERRPLLLVLDEAHNLCPPDPETPLGVAVRDRIIQIAAEGRKYGLWLLLSTQRPSKVHPGIVSQCDNLTLMRMNSSADLDELGTVFGFVPDALLRQAARFRQGEALVAGGFVAMPGVVQVRDRVTPQGGIDVPVPMS